MIWKILVAGGPPSNNSFTRCFSNRGKTEQ